MLQGSYVTAAGWTNTVARTNVSRRWGFEDAAWYVAHETFSTEMPRRRKESLVRAPPRGANTEGDQYDADTALMEQYREARSSRDAIRQLVEADAPPPKGSTASRLLTQTRG
jgi:hypothetical protein